MDGVRQAAVEAATAAAWGVYWGSLTPAQEKCAREDMELAIDAYERAMAEAGLVRVRDVGEKAEPLFERDMAAGRRFGWNACRAAMLASAKEQKTADGP